MDISIFPRCAAFYKIICEWNFVTVDILEFQSGQNNSYNVRIQ
jgi:hypothetical protein